MTEVETRIGAEAYQEEGTNVLLTLVKGPVERDVLMRSGVRFFEMVGCKRAVQWKKRFGERGSSPDNGEMVEEVRFNSVR